MRTNRKTYKANDNLQRLNDSEPSEDERMNRMLWALDSGFEHIEIDDSKLLEGNKNLVVSLTISKYLSDRSHLSA